MRKGSYTDAEDSMKMVHMKEGWKIWESLWDLLEEKGIEYEHGSIQHGVMYVVDVYNYRICLCHERSTKPGDRELFKGFAIYEISKSKLLEELCTVQTPEEVLEFIRKREYDNLFL